MSKDDKDKVQIIDKDLDLSNAGRGVWLVKVPKYIAQKWEKAPSNMDVGKLRISKTPGQKAQVSLSLTPAVLALDPDEKIPTEHVLDVSQVTKQTLGVFSHMAPEAAANIGKENSTAPGAAPDNEKLYMEGRIVQKLECRPIADTCYMKLKLESIRKASEPQRRVQPIDKIVQNFKPVKDHAHNIEYRERKKAEGKKARDDKNSVMDMLFHAFEKHQYYNIKDLVKITNQPISYLKEILKDVCDYNMKNPHKNMWELKKEYRHYKTEEKKDEEEHKSGSSDSE
ncbi:GL12621 [Drosophila persimilis]|uniref:General transcription factor IIF subunit 2 n=2 Tax=pseudoobscura subgroup TaxID=32358 RepID=A0A6I8US98_DROPS|nr:general transcription factor IIF subunit 2 [Drosophila pseudoobscura]XP_002019852.1 general transcription factor IIF subunit 2 [Drosophila persimilis]XP_017143063.1 general transcription factor IIF subunit 2 [Drosophila miranda]EDW38486.1 GL12621 [Drosophila persimilis]